MCKTLAEGGPCYSHTNERVRIQQDGYDNALDAAARKAGVPIDEAEVAANIDDYNALSSNANLALQIRKESADEQVSESEKLTAEAHSQLKEFERKGPSVFDTKTDLAKRFESKNGTESAEVFYHPEKDESFCGYPDANVVADRFEYMKTTQAKVRQAEDSLKVQREAFDRAVEDRLLKKDFNLRSLKRQATARAYKNIFTDNSIKNPENMLYQKALDTVKQERQVGSRYAGETTFYKEEQRLAQFRAEFSEAEGDYHTEVLNLKSHFSTYDGPGRPSTEDGTRDAQDNAMVRNAIGRMNQSILGSRPGDYERSKLRCRNRDLTVARNDSTTAANAIDELNREHKEYEVNVRKNASIDPVLKSEFEQEVFSKADGKELKKALNTTKKSLYMTPTYRTRLKKHIETLPDGDPDKAKHTSTLEQLNTAHAQQTQKAKKVKEAKVTTA